MKALILNCLTFLISITGEARCEAELVVQAKKQSQAPKQAPGPQQEEAPTVVEPLKDVNVKEGSAVTLKCRITGKPRE